jgi:hypothetical protein
MACAGIALFGISACGGDGHNAPPDARVLGTRVDSPLPMDMDMDGTPDGEASDAAADGGVAPDTGPLTPDPAPGQAGPTSKVTSPS